MDPATNLDVFTFFMTPLSPFHREFSLSERNFATTARSTHLTESEVKTIGHQVIQQEF